MTAGRRTLTVTCQAGMSNRLRVLLSGKALAEASGREFAMRWRPLPACGCLFHQLFENDWTASAAVPFDEDRAIDLTHLPWAKMPNFLTSPETALYIQSFSWLIQPKRRTEHVPLEARCAELLQALEPTRALAQRIGDFQNKFFRPAMIGVHLRRGDHIVTRPDVTANLGATLTRVDGWLAETPDAGILLCTDDGALDPYTGRAVDTQNVVARFVKRYGERVVFTTPSSLDRRTPKAIQDGLVDLWLLRATDYFVGTLGSSFSELAVFGRTIPFEQAAVGTTQYQRRVRWLKRLRLYEPAMRLGYHEFGRPMPLESVVRRYMIRLRVLLTGKI